MADTWQTTFCDAFSWVKMIVFWYKFHLILFLLVRLHWLSLQWRHNGCDSVSSHQPHDCLLNRLFRRRSKKTPKLRVTGLCAQMASNAENVSIWWRHHDWCYCWRTSTMPYVVTRANKVPYAPCLDVPHTLTPYFVYRQNSNISHTLVGNVGAAPTTSLFST